jgi:hypothetical protein
MFQYIAQMFQKLIGIAPSAPVVDVPVPETSTVSSGSMYITSPPNDVFFKQEAEYLMDFSPDRYGSGGVVEVSQNDFPGRRGRTKASSRRKRVKRQTIEVPVTPKSVLAELERRPTMWALNGLDSKIDLLKEKLEITQQHVARNELQALIDLLENRKKVEELDSTGTPFGQFFAQFDTTDDAKVQALCTKHGLVKRPADIFIPEFPADATRIMTAYIKKCKELTGKKPLLFVIATPESFNEAYGKRDPILLASSPFGFYYHILGAWDAEMLYLPEL